MKMDNNMNEHHRRLFSSIGRTPDCRAGGREFEPQTGPTGSEENVLPL